MTMWVTSPRRGGRRSLRTSPMITALAEAELSAVVLTDANALDKPEGCAQPLDRLARTAHEREAHRHPRASRHPCLHGVPGQVIEEEKVTSISSPPSGRARAVTWAPWAWAIALTMARPSPCPSVCPTRSLPICCNG
jgi:hypothetical protein